MIVLIYTIWVILHIFTCALASIGCICICEVLRKLIFENIMYKYGNYKYQKLYTKEYRRLKLEHDILKRSEKRIKELEELLEVERRKYPLFYWREFCKEEGDKNE